MQLLRQFGCARFVRRYLSQAAETLRTGCIRAVLWFDDPCMTVRRTYDCQLSVVVSARTRSESCTLAPKSCWIAP
jgi:hypothetical protein